MIKRGVFAVLVLALMILSVGRMSADESQYVKCGSADGKPSMNKPTANLCEKGTASAITESADKQYWVWSCSQTILGKLYATPCSSYKKVVEVFWISGDDDGWCNNGNNMVNEGTIETSEFSSIKGDCNFVNEIKTNEFQQRDGCIVYAREEGSLLSSDQCSIGVVKFNYIFDGTYPDAATSNFDFSDYLKKFQFSYFIDTNYDDGKSTGCIAKKWSWGFHKGVSSYLCKEDKSWHICDADVEGKEITSQGTIFKCEKEIRGEPSSIAPFDFYMWRLIGRPIDENCKGMPIGPSYGTSSNPYKITCCQELQKIGRGNYGLDAYYELANNIDCSDTKDWSSTNGFSPIGSLNNPFTGSFDGKGYKIDSLFISGTQHYVGLFGVVSVLSKNIKNIELTNVNIKGGDYVGCLVGNNNGKEISNSGCSGSVTGVNYVGGLVGHNENGYLYKSYFNGDVNGDNQVGGLAGANDKFGIITNSYSKGNVNGNSQVGGLAGINYGSIDKSYSISTIKGDERKKTGGLVGENYKVTNGKAIITNSFFAGNINERYNLVGEVSGKGAISNNYLYFIPIVSIPSIGWNAIGLCIGNDQTDQSGCYIVNAQVYPKDFHSSWDYSVMSIIYELKLNYYYLQFVRGLYPGNIGIDYFQGAVVTSNDKKNEPFDKWDFINTWAEIATPPSSINDFPMLKWEVSCGKANGETGVADKTALKSKGLCPDGSQEHPSYTLIFSDKSGMWEWRCLKDSKYSSSLCSATKVGYNSPTTEANCGTSDSGTFSTKELITKPCVDGNILQSNGITLTTDGKYWQWTCIGTHGITKSCSATKKTISCSAFGGHCEVLACANAIPIGQKDCQDGEVCCIPTNIIPECTLTDDCWLQLQDSHCITTGTNKCKCESGYTPTGTGGCTQTTTPTCSDRIQNQGETGVDCGGPCPACSKGGEGVCNPNINGKEFDDFGDLNDIFVNKGGCNSGTESELSGDPNNDKLYTWKCGTTFCSATIKEIPGSNPSYAIDGDCDYAEFVEIKYTNNAGQEVTRKVYCPAPLPFFTLTNIVAVLVVVGIFYVIMQRGRKGKSSKRKR